MKINAKKIGMIIAILIILGFVFGFIGSLIGEYGWACTEMMCMPTDPNFTGQMPCNSCFQEKPLFILGIINVVERCTGGQIVVYENGRGIDSRVDVMGCQYEWYFLTFNLKYLFSNPEQPIAVAV